MKIKNYLTINQFAEVLARPSEWWDDQFDGGGSTRMQIWRRWTFVALLDCVSIIAWFLACQTRKRIIWVWWSSVVGLIGCWLDANDGNSDMTTNPKQEIMCMMDVISGEHVHDQLVRLYLTISQKVIRFSARISDVLATILSCCNF
jgi:hypothetical protein